MPRTESVIKESLDADAGEWLARFARFGYAAKGFVYVLVGSFALIAAFRAGATVEDSHGALTTLLDEPFGKTMLVLTGVGLLGFVIWRFLQAFKDTENSGTGPKALINRTGFVISGMVHAGLAYQAFKLISGGHTEDGEAKARDWTARLMAQPFGRTLAFTIGAIILAWGIREFVVAWKASFMKHIRKHKVEENTLKGIRAMGRLGHFARGVVMVITGFFLGVAAKNYDPDTALGMAGALRKLQQQQFGPTLIGIVGLGLLGYGLFQFVNARYRSIRPEDLT